MAWLEEQQNQPSRSDHYLMRIALEVRRVLMNNPNKVQLKDMQIEFETGEKKEPTKEDIKKSSQASRSRWRGMFNRALGRKSG